MSILSMDMVEPISAPPAIQHIFSSSGSDVAGTRQLNRIINRSSGNFTFDWHSIVAVADQRTAPELLQRIRYVIDPSMSDLAATCGVTRQMLYKWLDGSEPEKEKLNRLYKLVEVAEALAPLGLIRPAALLRSKLFDGESILDTIRNDTYSAAHLKRLVAEAKAVKAARVHSGIDALKGRPNTEWESSIAIPGGFDRT